MKKTPEGTRLTPLEWFLLVLIGFGGATSTYDLRRVPGLTWGGVRTALAALEKGDLLNREETGKHGKRGFVLTPSAKAMIDRHRWYWDLDPDADMEGVFRSVWITSIFSRKEARSLLENFIEVRRKKLAAPSTIPFLREPDTKLLDSYIEMRRKFRSHQLNGEIEALREFQKVLEDQPNA